MKKLVACLFTALICNFVQAQEFAIPPNSELLAHQQEVNIKELRRIVEQSVQPTQALITGFTLTPPDQFIIIRLYRSTLALARWGERYAYINMWNTPVGGTFREVPAAQWQTAFKAIAEHKQQPAAKPRRDPNRWSPGYAGVVHVRGQGKERDYLLSTDDLYEYHNRNPVDAFVCRNLGNHCSTADWTSDEWVLKFDEQLKKAPKPMTFARDRELCENVTLENFALAEQMLADGADINGWQGNGSTCYSNLYGPKYIKQRAWLVAHKALINKPNFLGYVSKQNI
ncbi:MAG TPA: hypothetical protein VIZ65_06385 [Cellvibrionaceae bacterium]